MDKEAVMDDTGEFKIGERFGSLSTDIKHIKNAVDRVVDKLDDVNDHVIQLNGTTVKAEQCIATHKELMAVLAHKQTRQDYHAVGNLLQSGKQSLLMRIKDNLTAIAAIVIAVGVLGGGIWWMATKVVAVNSALTLSQKEQTRAIQKIEDKVNKPKVIYVNVPTPAIPIPEPNKKRRYR